MTEGSGAHPGRREVLGRMAAAVGVLAVAPLACTEPGPGVMEPTPAPGGDVANPLLWALAWKQTAAEYGALCHQAFNLARMLLEQALVGRTPGDRPLAVITDLDDTLLHAGSYWGHLVERQLDFFDDAIWDAWIPRNLVTAAPGAREFLEFAREAGVEVFYVTNRDQGEETFAYALGHLRVLGFPFADEDHLTVLRDTSDKSGPRERIAATHEVALLLGDNLNDFKRDYYVADVEERRARMEADRELFGRRFVLLPNPTDGHWVRAIFGESEPPPTVENRARLREAATRGAWDGGAG